MALGKELSVNQSIPMRPEDRTELRVLAAKLGVGPGLLGRALIFAGLQRFDDPQVQAALKIEIEAQNERQSAAGQAAMAARYGHNREPGEQ